MRPADLKGSHAQVLYGCGGGTGWTRIGRHKALAVPWHWPKIGLPPGQQASSKELHVTSTSNRGEAGTPWM